MYKKAYEIAKIGQEENMVLYANNLERVENKLKKLTYFYNKHN